MSKGRPTLCSHPNAPERKTNLRPSSQLNHLVETRAWFLYVLRCADGTLYTGITTNLARRVAEHNAGRGARYTAGRRPVTLLAAWRFLDRGTAQRVEARFRRLSRARKLSLIAQEQPFKNAPFSSRECSTDTSATPDHF